MIDPTTIAFTVWIGSCCLRGTDNVDIGTVLRGASITAHARPTFDAQYEVVEDDDADKTLI